MNTVLKQFIPEFAVEPCMELIQNNRVNLKIVPRRNTKHGDYRRMADGRHQITVNATLNKYRFLITLVHEIAHLVAFEKYGRRIKPHGMEWKYTFQGLMLPFIRPEVFPPNLLPVIAHHFKNPRASSDTDAELAIRLKKYDPENDKSYVFELPVGSVFRIYNGKLFQKGNRRVKRYECLSLVDGKTYLFQPNAEVELIKEG
ncbi:MAG: SprT-like domain-containing protein [Flavobacteriaceae bacterium]|nr:SprT-like domain-containing protein [Flavobacteriaceae bacterium]